MKEQFARTERLLGTEAVEALAVARVAVVGLGGVGGYTGEALARSGVGSLDLIDPDRVEVTNLNRQILATWETVGRYKTDVAAERIHKINPDATVHTHRVFFLPDTAGQFDFSRYDYVVDAIDTVTGKLALIERALAAGTPVISCMGAGNRMDASAFCVADLSETKVCPMARVMRRELKKRGIEHVKVVYSEEPVPETGAPGADADSAAEKAAFSAEGAAVRAKQVPGSNAFAPGTAGLILAGEVVRDLVGRGTAADRCQ